MPLLPRFTIVDAQKRIVRYAHSDGICATEIPLGDLRGIDDIMALFPLTHPDWEGFFAVYRWLRNHGYTLRDLVDSAAVRNAYATATYTPLGVSA